MNRFDRVTSLLLLLQTRSMVTAKFLADYFNVSERTIYRDINTLENAGVPIRAQAGVGYFLEKGYHLPPISFTLDEAASLLLGEKLLVSSLDKNSLKNFKQAFNKVKSVIDSSDKDYLSSFDSSVKVFPTGSHFPVDDIKEKKERIYLEDTHSTDKWLIESRNALVNHQVVKIEYTALSSNKHSSRYIEPIGLFYYSWHWHLIGWCRLRETYRDFRLDRILTFLAQSEKFIRDNRLSFQEYLNEQKGSEELETVEIIFGFESARFVGEQRYMFGFIGEEKCKSGIRMKFLTHVPEYMARRLLQYTNDIEVVVGDSIQNLLKKFTSDLTQHWGNKLQK